MFSQLMIIISFIPRVQQRHAVFFRNLRVAAFSNEKYTIAFRPKMPSKNGIIRSIGWTSAPYKNLFNSPPPPHPHPPLTTTTTIHHPLSLRLVSSSVFLHPDSAMLQGKFDLELQFTTVTFCKVTKCCNAIF